jgi:hypothetical protein
MTFGTVTNHVIRATRHEHAVGDELNQVVQPGARDELTDRIIELVEDGAVLRADCGPGLPGVVR